MCSSTIRMTRSRTSGENVFALVMTPFSQMGGGSTNSAMRRPGRKPARAVGKKPPDSPGMSLRLDGATTSELCNRKEDQGHENGTANQIARA